MTAFESSTWNTIEGKVALIQRGRSVPRVGRQTGQRRTCRTYTATDSHNETELEDRQLVQWCVVRSVGRAGTGTSVKFTDAGPNQVDGRRRIIISKRDVWRETVRINHRPVRLNQQHTRPALPSYLYLRRLPLRRISDPSGTLIDPPDRTTAREARTNKKSAVLLAIILSSSFLITSDGSTI